MIAAIDRTTREGLPCAITARKRQTRCSMYAAAISHYILMIIESRCRISHCPLFGSEETRDLQGEHSIGHSETAS